MDLGRNSKIKLSIIVIAAVFLIMAAGSLLADITIGEFSGISERTIIQIIIGFFFTAISMIIIGYNNFSS